MSLEELGISRYQATSLNFKGFSKGCVNLFSSLSINTVHIIDIDLHNDNCKFHICYSKCEEKSCKLTWEKKYRSSFSLTCQTLRKMEQSGQDESAKPLIKSEPWCFVARCFEERQKASFVAILINTPRRQSVFRSTHARELVSNEAMKRGSD